MDKWADFCVSQIKWNESGKQSTGESKFYSFKNDCFAIYDYDVVQYSVFSWNYGVWKSFVRAVRSSFQGDFICCQFSDAISVFICDHDTDDSIYAFI